MLRSGFLCASVVCVSLLVACGDDGAPATTTAGATSEATTTGDPSATSVDTPTTAATGDGSTGALDDTGGPVMGECILWGSDCSLETQKCMPWSEDADRLPDETRCCALVENPDLVGEPCEVMDYDGSCLDTCEEGSMCVVDEPDMLTGTCRAFCQPSNPTCEGDETCKTFFELLPEVLNVPMCMDKCDPLLQDCVQSGWLCIPDSPTLAGQSGFICVPPPPQPPIGVLDPCALANDCEPGLVCLSASRVPDCTGFGCCSAYCDVAEADPCPAIHPDMVCVNWMSPDPEWSDVGACAIPD